MYLYKPLTRVYNILCGYNISHFIHVINVYFMKLNDILFISFVLKDDKKNYIHAHICNDDTKKLIH
jgi:hypothetical protein